MSDKRYVVFGVFVCCVRWAACSSSADRVFSVEVPGNETQFTLRELLPNQAYRLRMAAGNGAGFGVPAEWTQHHTPAHYNHSMGRSPQTSLNKGAVSLSPLSLSLSFSHTLSLSFTHTHTHNTHTRSHSHTHTLSLIHTHTHNTQSSPAHFGPLP